MLRISRLALFFTFFSALPMIPALAGETSGELGKGNHRHHHDVRHIEASLHNSSMRRGGPIVINRHDRFSH
jgi:hypothetical protein